MFLWFGLLLFIIVFSLLHLLLVSDTSVSSTEAVTIHSVTQAVLSPCFQASLLTAIMTATVSLCVVEAPFVKP